MQYSQCMIIQALSISENETIPFETHSQKVDIDSFPLPNTSGMRPH
jgi:hypothetical protein